MGNTEGFLIRKVMDLFIKCNRISAIAQDPEELARAGAQTLAVHLFQEAVVLPEDEDERCKLRIRIISDCRYKPPHRRQP